MVQYADETGADLSDASDLIYMKAFDNAMTESDFCYISDYLKAGSPIYKTQKKYVEKDISEQLESYEIVNTKYSKNKKQRVVTTRETYYVQKTGEPLNLMTQQCKYKLVLDYGEWKMTFYQNVRIILILLTVYSSSDSTDS